MESKTHIVILGLLSEQPLSGYDIKKLIEIRFRFFWNESYGQIYPVLKKLTQQGLIVTADEPSSRRNTQRYAITETGRETMRQWLLTNPEKESVRIELLLKLYFSSPQDPSLMIDYISTFMASHQRDLMILNLFKTELEKIDDPYLNHQNIISVIDFGLKTNQAYLDWCKETIKRLEASHEPQ